MWKALPAEFQYTSLGWLAQAALKKRAKLKGKSAWLMAPLGRFLLRFLLSTCLPCDALLLAVPSGLVSVNEDCGSLLQEAGLLEAHDLLDERTVEAVLPDDGVVLLVLVLSERVEDGGGDLSALRTLRVTYFGRRPGMGASTLPSEFIVAFVVEWVVQGEIPAGSVFPGSSFCVVADGVGSIIPGFSESSFDDMLDGRFWASTVVAGWSSPLDSAWTAVALQRGSS
jgi:hypothetical protein